MQKKRKPRVGDVVKYVPMLWADDDRFANSLGLVISHNKPARILIGWNRIIEPGGEDEEYIIQFFDQPDHPEPVLPSAIEVVTEDEIR